MTKKTVLLSLVLSASAALTGCRTVALDPAGQMVAVYQFGEFRMLVNCTAPVAAKAAQKAVEQLDLFQTHVVVNKFEAQVLARSRNDQKITINIEEANSLQTLVRIRWGEGGDLAKSRKLFEAIDGNLK